MKNTITLRFRSPLFFPALRRAPILSRFNRKLWTLLVLLALPVFAHATLVVTHPSPGSDLYVDDFATAKEAEAACNAMLFAKACIPNTVVESGPNGTWVRYPSFTKNQINYSNGTSITVTFYYCEFPNVKDEGSHKCWDGGIVPQADPKNNGMPSLDCDCDDPRKAPKLVGNPINPASGNKIQLEVDYEVGGGPSKLALARFYNSKPVDAANRAHLFGPLWTTAYDATLTF